ncbi:uncharacterized protein [Montipora capricornis]|uniref:uncharacterized protein isoform X2 n=1 Tax=Montipora capricornis TaxID=246305 RepID=UPI0035F142BA
MLRLKQFVICPFCRSFCPSGRFDIHTASRPDEDYFVASTDAINQLMGTMAKYNGRCPLCGYDLGMQSFEVLRHGHTVRISVFCAAGHSLRWFSSNSISGKFTANLRSSLQMQDMTQVVLHNTPLFQLYLSGHRIGEVAHDYVLALKTWLNGKGIKNSYDSWHGRPF